MIADQFSNARAVWDINFKQRDAYAGNCIRIYRRNGAFANDGETDIGFTAGGVIDKQAILDFCLTGDGFIKTIYDQSGNGHHLNQDQATADEVYQICVSGTLNEDADGNLFADSSDGFFLRTSDGLGGITDFSLFTRIQKDTLETQGALFSESASSSGLYALYMNSGDSNTSIDAAVGSPNYYKDGSLFAGSSRGDLYTHFHDASPTWSIWSITNGSFTPATLTNFRWAYGAFQTLNHDFQSAVIFSDDKTAEESDIRTWLSNQYLGIPNQGATITQPVTITLNSSS